MRYLVGVDEAGRGPLAGPVTVGVAVIEQTFDWSLLPGVGDSKKLSEKKREAVFARAMELKGEGRLNFAVGQTAAALIDKGGIVGAVETAMRQALEELALDPDDCELRLDGALRAPAVYRQQTTIIRGDALEPIIGLASIMAKVTRDRYMAQIGAEPRFAPYRFAVHKGYGTKEHRELIREHGLSVIHRASFCRHIHK